MINPSRRSMLRMLGLSSLAASAAAQAAEKSILAETGIGTVGQPSAFPQNPPPEPLSKSRMLQLLADPETRDELESLHYRLNQRVVFLDPDIANKRSFSLAAKVTFQRQRNVEREDPEGRLCAVSAIEIAADNAKLFVEAMSRLQSWLRAHYSIPTIAGWNDAPGRTKEEVVAALRAAASALRLRSRQREQGTTTGMNTENDGCKY